MLLKNLIENLPKEKKIINIKGLASDSRKVKKGYIFFAIRGKKFNGEKFIGEAIKNGAIIIICSNKCKFKSKNITIIKSFEIRNLLSKIASKFYKLKPKNIIAVTGTNGKTSVADLFSQILTINHKPVASIGTLGVKYKKKIIKTDLTSPDIIFLHKTLENLKKKKIDNVIIEASSHGLDQKRLNHINFKAAIFTNFSQDHLDYHKTMKSYFKAKLFLFENILSKNKTVISDKSIKEFEILKKISNKKNLKLIDITSIIKKLEKNRKNRFYHFQQKNLSMAIAAVKLCNIKEKNIFNSLDKIKDVDGRVELVRTFPQNIKVFVDFAHTPDALQNILNALKKSHSKNITLVFGCGGERDFKKRPLMAKIASLNCKKIYVTDDNPRNENPKKIRKEITKNIKIPNCYNIGERSKAIESAILNAEPNEIILIAGKGHETEQIFKNRIINISDKKIIKSIKIKNKEISKKKHNFLQNKKILREFKKNANPKNFHGLAIDSRVANRNNLFLTIKGKNNDGTKFIPDVLKKGIKNIISSKESSKYKKKIIKVKSEFKFLNFFALKKREYSSAKIIAITGSAGKTSLKDLLQNLLQNYGETYSSPKSYNNHFGVPLSLTHLSTFHKYGIFEAGMSKAGEINSLSKMIKPHIGVITNIGEAHIENFENLKGIANAKAEILNNIKEGGTIILNQDDKYFNFLKNKANRKNLKVITFGLSKTAHVHPIKYKKQNLSILSVKDQILKLSLKKINIYNVLSSLAVLKELDLNLNKIIRHFKNYEPLEGRGKTHTVKRYNKIFKLIDESYNANPLSVKNAIKNFSSIKKQNFKKYLILGDMLELGKHSLKLHKNLSKVINNSDIDKVFVKGDKTLTTYKNIIKHKRGNIFQKDDDVDSTLCNIIANNDYLMIKGSNSTGLYNISNRIIKGN